MGFFFVSHKEMQTQEDVSIEDAVQGSNREIVKMAAIIFTRLLRWKSF